MGKKHICLDIGGTKVLGVVFNEKNEIVLRVKKKTKAEKGFDNVENTIISVVEELISSDGFNKDELASISAGAPGVIDEEKGVILYAPNLPWKNYNIKKVIEDKFKVPFFIGNDANVGMLGEWKYGSAKGKKNAVGLFVGTGMGGGVIINDKLFTGGKHAGTELGHMIISAEGPYCNCGQKGCLEALSSKIGITRDVKVQISRGRSTILKDFMDEDDGIIKSKALKTALAQGDKVAEEVMDRAIYYLAVGAGSLINIFNPDIFVLGGGVVEAIGDYILPRFCEYVPRFSMPSVIEGTEIALSTLGDDSIIFGALALSKTRK